MNKTKQKIHVRVYNSTWEGIELLLENSGVNLCHLTAADKFHKFLRIAISQKKINCRNNFKKK